MRISTDASPTLRSTSCSVRPPRPLIRMGPPNTSTNVSVNVVVGQAHQGTAERSGRPGRPDDKKPALQYRLGMITAADVREVAVSLPRTEEHLIRDYIKFRVGRIVYASVSPDETMIGFGFPKEERAAMIASRPDVFVLPRLSDQRFQWINARMAALGKEEMAELIFDAWRMVVPKRVAAAHLGSRSPAGGEGAREG